jgi:hypothetical protein
MLPPRYRYAIEFRHPSWYAPQVIDMLRKHYVSFCLSDHHHAPAPWIGTAKHVYVRGHGPGGRYKDSYPEGTLRVADHIRKWRRQGKSVFTFFDNEQKSAAPAHARRLMALLGVDRDDCTATRAAARRLGAVGRTVLGAIQRLSSLRFPLLLGTRISPTTSFLRRGGNEQAILKAQPDHAVWLREACPYIGAGFALT